MKIDQGMRSLRPISQVMDPQPLEGEQTPGMAAHKSPRRVVTWQRDSLEGRIRGGAAVAIFQRKNLAA